MNRFSFLSPVIAASLLLAGCMESGTEVGHSQYSDRDSSPALHAGDTRLGINGKRSSVRVDFDPENQVIPFPNNLMFEAGAISPADLDGRLNVPLPEDPNDSSANVAKALNDLDGFSTVEAWRLAFTGPIDANTLQVGKTVRVFELVPVLDAEGNPASYPQRLHAKAVKRELTAADLQINYEEDAANNAYVVYILPKKPLAHNTTYSVIFTYGILDTQGHVVDAPLAASVSRGTTKLGLNRNNEPTRCHKFFSAKDFADPEQERSLTLLQCMTYLGYHPVLKEAKHNLVKDDIMMSWAITTQRKDEPFERLVGSLLDGSALAGNNPVVGGMTCNQPICFLDVGSLPGKSAPKTPGNKATVFPGTIRLPIMTTEMKEALSGIDNEYFMDKNNKRLSRANAEKLTQGVWRCDGGSCNTDAAREGMLTPKIEGWVTYPIVSALPDKCTKTNKCPLVIFQHAIQQDRTNALAFADSLADQGFAVVGIDMPLHGMEKRFLDMSNPKDASRAQLYAPDLNDQLYNSALSAARNIIPLMVEGTFFMDMVHDDGATEKDGSTKADGRIDPSGTHFLNPALPLAQRDILRQSTVNLAALSHYLYSGKYQQCGIRALLKSCNTGSKKLNELIDFKNLHFVGHSVGNIVSMPFLAMDKNIQTITMLAPAGVLLRTLEGSEVIGKKLADGLNEKGVFKGTENYYRFFASVQAAIDPAEPFNYLDELTDRPINIVAIYGDQTNSQDKVLPWKIAGSAMAGSEHLVRLLGISNSNQMQKQGQAVSQGGAFTFTENTSDTGLQMAMLLNRGDHASFLLPKNEVFAKAAKEEQEAKELLENHLIGHAQNKVASLQQNIRELTADIDKGSFSAQSHAEKVAQLAELKTQLTQAQQKLSALENDLHNFFIPQSEDDIFFGNDVHHAMQEIVGNFLKHQGKQITGVDADILYLSR